MMPSLFRNRSTGATRQFEQTGDMMNGHRLILSATHESAVICLLGLVFMFGWPADSAARPKRPGMGNHVCTCGCSYRADDGQFYFQNGHNPSTNMPCSGLNDSNATCEVRTGGRTYSGILTGCSGDGAGMDPPAAQAPSTIRPMQPPAIPIPPPAAR